MVFLLYLIIGALAGILSGLVGIGGGVVVVPLLASIFEHKGVPPDMVMHFAAGTSLAVMMVTTTASMRAHIKLGDAIWPIFRRMIPGLSIGVIAGATLADFLHSHELRLIFGGLLLLTAVKTFLRHEVHPRETLPTFFMMSVASFGLGVLSGLLGVGGGTIMVPFLLMINVSIRIAVAVSTACGLLAAIIGTVSYMITGANEIHTMAWTTGYIYWPAFFGVAMASPIFATLGAQISHRVSVTHLRRLFSLFIFLAAIKLLVF